MPPIIGVRKRLKLLKFYTHQDRRNSPNRPRPTISPNFSPWINRFRARTKRKLESNLQSRNPSIQVLEGCKEIGVCGALLDDPPYVPSSSPSRRLISRGATVPAVGYSTSSACCRTRRGTHAARQELRRIRDLPCGLREARSRLAASLGARARWRGAGAR
jgi:hypothetical protein